MTIYCQFSVKLVSLHFCVARHMMEGKTCPACDRKGQRSLLKSYQINLEEAVTICANKTCTYPLSDSLCGLTFSRQVSDVQSSRQSVSTVPASQQELQSRAVARMKILGVQLQNHGKGIQTGSPQVDKLTSACRRSLTSRDTIQSVSNSYVNFLPYHTRQNIGDQTVPSVVQASLETLNAPVDICKEQANQKYWRKRHGSAESLGDDSMNSNSDYMDSSSDRGSTDRKVHLVQNVFPFSCSPENACTPNLLEALCTESVTETTHLDFRKFYVQVQEKFETNLPIKLVKSCIKPCCYPKRFVQWKNKDNLCWLDVVLCLCVHNMTLKRQVFGSSFDTDCLMYKLLKAHDQAQSLLMKSKSEGKEDLLNISYIHTDTTRQLSNMVQGLNDIEINSFAGEEEDERTIKDEDVHFNYSEIATILNGIREEVWQFLQTKLRCRRGQHESPVFALPLFLRQSPELSDVFKMKYSFEYKCTCCDYTESHSFENLLPTFPELVDDFRIASPSHKKKCPECGNSDDVRTMVYKHIPDTLLMHFTSGLPSMPLSDLQLHHHGNTYTVTGLVQYQEGIDVPNHFMAWLRNPDDNMWMKCDDLDGSVCGFNHSQPAVPSSEVHIVMWEKVISKTRTCRQLAMVPDNVLINNGNDGNSISSHDDRENLLNTDDCGVSNRNSGDANFNQRKGIKTTLYEPFKFGETQNLTQGSQSGDVCKTDDQEPTSTARFTCAEQFFDVDNKQDMRDSDSGLSSMCNEPIRITKRKKPDTRNLSQCSVASSESSESIHLPKFVDMTPVTGAVQRPIACRSKMSFISKNSIFVPNSEMSNSINLNVQALVGNVSRHECNMKSEKANQSVCDSDEPFSLEPDFELPTVLVVPCSKLNGIVSAINPSTVFCKPIKTMPHTVPSVALPETCIKSESSVSTALGGSLPERNEKDHVQPESQVIAKVSKPLTIHVPSDNNRHSDNSTPKSGRGSSQSSRFKLPPFSGLNKRKTSIDRNAFFTLEKQKVVNQENTSITLKEASSTLSQVKQYLLTRTAGIARTKFEGLNLKSNVESSTGYPVLSQSYEQFTRSMNMHNLSANSENNSSQNGLNMQTTMSSILTKRKSFSNMSDFHHVDHKKSKEETGTSNEANSLKENFLKKKNNSQLRKQTVRPSYTGKNRSMVDKWATDSMNMTDRSETPELLRKSFVPMSTEKDLVVGSDTVLQDLYDALNIPFNDVQDTMTSIMTDVDDILQFVDANDAFRDDMRAASPDSCRSIPVFREHFKTDCMVRIPGRNSA